MFLRQYQRQRKCFLSERELKKALRDTVTRAAWLGPSNFWLVRSEHAHASYPGLFFRPPEFSPYMGREERRGQGLDFLNYSLICSSQYNTIQYNTIQYNTIQYNTIQYNTIQYNTIFYSFSPRGFSELIYNMNKIMTKTTDLNYDDIHFLEIKLMT